MIKLADGLAFLNKGYLREVADKNELLGLGLTPTSQERIEKDGLTCLN